MEFSSCVEGRKKRCIVIIGAGAAGLGAARWLLDNDVDEQLEVCVVESRNRAGGRVWTTHEFDTPVDLGAAWLHDHEETTNPVSIMAQRLHLEIRNTVWENSIPLDLSGRRLSDKVVDRSWNDLEKAFIYAAKVQSDGDVSRQAMSVESLIKEAVGEEVWGQPAFQSWCADYDFEFGTSLKNVSPAAVNQDWICSVEEEEEEYNMSFPRTGYEAIIQGLLSGEGTDNVRMRCSRREDSSSRSGGSRRTIPIIHNHRVVSVDSTGGSNCAASSEGEANSSNTYSSSGSSSINTAVRIVCEVVDAGCATSTTTPSCMKELQADAVICTVPVGVLKAESIQFLPPLSAPKLDAIRRVGCGNAVKVVMEFSTVFWPSNSELMHVVDASLCSDFGAERDSEQTRGVLTHFWNYFLLSGKKILVGFALGDGAHIVDRMSDAELEALIAQRMRALSGGRADIKPNKLKPLRWTRTKWALDPNSLCTYSYLPAGEINSEVFDELNRRENDALWFAGEACQSSASLRASVHGAWHSGVRTARQLTETCFAPDIPVCTPGVESYFD